MEKILHAFTQRKRAVLLVLLLIFLYGFAAYKSIPRERFPDIDFPNIYVSVSYEGISPEDSEKLLIKPLENSLKTVEGVKHVTAFANEGWANLVLEFEAGFDSDKALNDIRNKVDETKSDLPAEADEPIVKEINLSLFPVLNVIVTGDFPYRTLRSVAKDLQERIEGVSEVMEANISGFAEEVIEIQIEPKFIETYKLSMSDLKFVIDNNNKLVAAGILKTQTGDFPVKFPGLIDDYDELLQFPIKTDGNQVIRLKDVATVKRTYKEAESIARVNGQNAVVVEVIKRTGENLISTITKVKAAVEAEAEMWPEGITIVYAQDQSDEIIDVVDDLENNIIIGVILVMVVILLTVGPRAALLIALSIPSSFLAGILLLAFYDVSLNIVVLFSLILTVGMIVDDAIVVSEYADRQMELGQDPDPATIFPSAAYRMLWPVITSTFVKLVVFFPLLFWPGLIGQFMKFMPITVLVVLTNSAIYALVFLPSIGSLLGVPKEYLHGKEPDLGLSLDWKQITGFRLKYALLLKKVLLRPKLFVLGVFGALICVYVIFIVAGPGSEFFPDVEPDNAMVTMQSIDNLSIQGIDKKMREIEDIVLQFKDEIRTFYTRTGHVKDEQMPQNTVGYIQLEFIEWNKRRKARYILADIEEALKPIKGVGIQVLKEKQGPPSTKPIHLDISGSTPQKIDAAADLIKEYLEADKQFKDLEDSRSSKEIEWVIKADRAKLSIYNIDFDTIGASFRLLTNGYKVSTYRPLDVEDELDVIIRFPSAQRGLMHLDNIKIVTPKGVIPLGNVITLKPQFKVSEIKRVDRKRVATLMADLIEGVLANDKVAQIKQFIESDQMRQTGATVEFRGEQQDQAETAAFLVNAFILTLILMFLVMLIQFNSFYHTTVIMSAVFLSSVGVFVGHLITWQPFGVVMSGVGIIALGGIVLNNNILFIDTYQRLRHSGVPLYDAIIISGVERLRPILLTACTAVLGLMPMVIGLTINFYSREVLYDAPSSQWWRQLSASIAGGLSFATILTLFFTPCLLLMGKRWDIKDPDQ